MLSVSDYKVRLKNQSGLIVAEFDNWLSLNFNHGQNRISNLRFEIDGRDSRTELFELDGQIEVWRRNLSADLDWYIEWEGMMRTPNELLTPGDDERYVAHAIDYLDLLKRAYILWAAKSAEAEKSGVGETIIKEIVDENIGAGALAGGGRLRNHVFTGLSVEADAANGTAWSGAFANRNAMSVVRSIAQATGLVVDIVGTGAATFEFQVYDGQRGEDKTEGTADPVIFSIGHGNMRAPLLSINRGDEFTAVVALGEGVESDQETAIVVSSAAVDSDWNDIELVVNAPQNIGTSQLTSFADSELQKVKKIEFLTFEVLQQPATFYGRDYTWGTKVTAEFGSFKDDIVIDQVDILINKESPQEKIRIKFSDENLVVT